MLATLIPVFDNEMNVALYSVFAQKENTFRRPSLLGTGSLDGAGSILGLELVEQLGLDNIAGDRAVFIEVNHASIFSDIKSQCKVSPEKLVLLIDSRIKPEPMYIDRIKQLKGEGFKIALKKVDTTQYEAYAPIINLSDIVFVNPRKVDITKVRMLFDKLFPHVRICAVNVNTRSDYDNLKAKGGADLYEGEFFRLPMSAGDREVAPLKINYIELVNVVNHPDFDLTEASGPIERDPALALSLISMVNRMTVNSGITSVNHAAAMLGQKELKKWINTAVAKEMCADKPSEVARMSMIRARFIENLAPLFEMGGLVSELFFLGLFSVVDLILDKPMDEALEMVTVSKPIREALLHNTGEYGEIYNFMLRYEDADWQEVSRVLLLKNIEDEPVYNAYVQALAWYRDIYS